MRKEYDFSNANRGTFYKPDKGIKVTVNVDEEDIQHPQFEVFSVVNGKFRFRLKNDSGTVFTSTDSFSTQEDCIAAINQLRHASVIAPTMVTSA